MKPECCKTCFTLRGTALLAALMVLTGCQIGALRPSPNAPAKSLPTISVMDSRVVAKNQDYAVVVAQPGDDINTLAERYLGDPRKAWVIADFNEVGQIRAGQDLVIPLRPDNITAVTPTGYHTVAILCYHRFGPRNKLSVTPAALEAQMEYLVRNGYRIVTLKQVADFVKGTETLPQKAVAVTIDDGYRSTYEIAFPIFKKYNIPATVFLYTDFVGAGDALTWAQMQEMQRSGLVDIQPHSKSHSNLGAHYPGESDAQYTERIQRELQTPASVIQDKLNVKSAYFAYPYGDTNAAVADMLAHQGVTLGLTVTPGGNGFFANPYMLRRTMVFGEDDMTVFKSKLTVFSDLSPPRQGRPCARSRGC